MSVFPLWSDEMKNCDTCKHSANKPDTEPCLSCNQSAMNKWWKPIQVKA